MDSARYTGITSAGPVTTSPADILDNSKCLPLSESPSNPTGIGPTQDDVSLIWLNDSCTTVKAVGLLEIAISSLGEYCRHRGDFLGPRTDAALQRPGLPPKGDPRTPDILVTPNIGVTYSGSTKKLAEHGGFAHDDTNVMMLLSYPSLDAKTVTSPVETMQVAPTILKGLGLEPQELESVRREGTQVLPGLFGDKE